MPPLTLEQVLARSMRLPRKQTKNATALASSHTTLGSSTFAPSPTTEVRRDTGAAKLFSLIEKEEEAVAAQRPKIHVSTNLIRNSQDLLTYLHAAKRMRAWEDALRSFNESTKMLLIRQKDDNSGVILTLRKEGEESKEAAGITANIAHLSVLLDTCASAKQWHLVEQLGEVFRQHSPQILVDAVSLLANTKKKDVKEDLYGWRRALHFLQSRIPPEEQPVEAYNACMGACEQSLDWEGALVVIRSMGPNNLQQLDTKSTPSVEEDGKKEVDEAVSVEREKTALTITEAREDMGEMSVLNPPKPDVITYATLISVLEQCGKNALASEVLQRLPPLEKEEITATYAALIHVWSEQQYRNHRRRF
ncbi:Pentatricopeptide repeat [Trypanosoma melophagium]|uniref:Pentatricopeptide repeat n=1 Tax=Trypanosoma melophagium TaxID=715481 RepID=UPI00351A4A31|nr:Pentatricopeptide repeat [Trypanosoma melophagium]